MAKYPKLTHKEINDEVVKRTGQSNQLVATVIRAYRDVMREAITKDEMRKSGRRLSRKRKLRRRYSGWYNSLEEDRFSSF